MLRTDGAVLARWPVDARAGDLASDAQLLKLIGTGAASGALTVAGDAGRGVQSASFRRVGDLPVYVVAGVSRSAMLGGWAKTVGMLAVIMLPITAGLVYVTWVALRKTRVEAAISRQLREEVHARADAERRILESQRLETLAVVTGTVAHDFNNMLAIITSSIHVLKLRKPELADEKSIGAISRSVQAGVRLTRQLLSFSKKQALRPEVIRFQSWLPAADALMRATLGASARWIASVDDDTLPVSVDAGELELALVNIVLNAKHAMKSPGELKLHISNDESSPADAPMVIVCVIDDGEGIPAEVLPNVFEPFFTTRQRGVGSGLGLTQVQGFCRQAGGKVTIQSVVGEGTTLCLHLPGLLNAEVGDSPALQIVTKISARLLLVEDNEDVGKTTEQMLQSSGVEVVRVTSADAALAYLASANPFPQIVLSDIAMPGRMNGIGLASALSRLYPGLPVILNTGYADQLEEGTAKGMRVFQKPVPPELLLAEIQECLRDVSNGA
ncbi:ATP-binding protein [Scleromatobacter humisilvae]|uniref:histidine kinase n=1 Tax=Scleromatobacter humisilvae TaxID=2897159 RepID=A0A9X1YN84_9BURK|nr:ATP-binding protein [Scleromatobacter humisilvae]MCK9689384.1 response regulator [Scleromatobacter humisilvae]